MTEKAPRDSNDKPWEHPADGGEPLSGHSLWAGSTRWFGYFQTSEEFPDDMANALRRLFEKMHRAGFRDEWCDGDYVECSYLFLRHGLEVNAREAFRLWYGEEKWRAMYRLASHLQEDGEVEFRIDYLLKTEFGVEIRKRQTEPEPPPTVQEQRKAKAPSSEKKNIVLAHYAEALRDGPLHAQQIADRINEKHGVGLGYIDVYNCLRDSPLVQTTKGKSEAGRHVVLYSLPDA